MQFKKNHIVSIRDFSKEEIVHILKVAADLEKHPRLTLLRGKVLASMFFEPSTRTRLSFETAMIRLGGSVISVPEGKTSSFAKGETIQDTVKVAERYADIIVIRHPTDGAARAAAAASAVPIINGGDGKNQHPTQTLLDLYTIKKTQGKVSGLHIALGGDLRYGRTVHSLAQALALFNCRIYLVSPPSLRMPHDIVEELQEQGIHVSEHENLEEVIPHVDILYLTRIQKERFADQAEFEKVKDAYVLKRSMLTQVKRNLKIMHPLPRVNEITTDVDDTPYACYFDQAANGVPVRQALLGMLLGCLR